jgi:hypothetical protein
MERQLIYCNLQRRVGCTLWFLVWAGEHIETTSPTLKLLQFVVENGNTSVHQYETVSGALCRGLPILF